MRTHHRAGIAGAAAALALAACGSSSTSAGGDAASAVQAALTNYGTQSSAHIKIAESGGTNPGTFDLDVTKDAASGSGTFSGQTVIIVYAGGHGYAQTTPGGAFSQLPDDIAKPFQLFTISTFASCLSQAGGGAIGKGDLSSASATTVNGNAANVYTANDGSGQIVISSGSNPLPLSLTIDTSKKGSSSSSTASNAACDLGSSSSSSSTSSGGTLTITWTYPGGTTTITPPPVTGQT